MFRQVLANLASKAGLETELHSKAHVLEDEGDYASAAQALRESVLLDQHNSSNEGLAADADAARLRVHDLTRLAEMKWRYRVVDVGESPREESIRILKNAQSIIDQCEGAALADLKAAGAAAELLDARRREFEREWAAEISAVLHGLGVTRLIFDDHEDEEVTLPRHFLDTS